MHNGAADYGGIGEFSDLPKLLWIRNAKAHGYRKFCIFADSLYKLARIAGKLLLLAGDART